MVEWEKFGPQCIEFVLLLLNQRRTITPPVILWRSLLDQIQRRTLMRFLERLPLKARNYILRSTQETLLVVGSRTCTAVRHRRRRRLLLTKFDQIQEWG